jgi:hypothetical protein
MAAQLWMNGLSLASAGRQGDLKSKRARVAGSAKNSSGQLHLPFFTPFA